MGLRPCKGGLVLLGARDSQRYSCSCVILTASDMILPKASATYLHLLMKGCHAKSLKMSMGLGLMGFHEMVWVCAGVD
jgi:hypothetical protein